MKSALRHLCAVALTALVLQPVARAEQTKPAAPAKSPASAASLPDPVAVVEGEKISRADLEEAFNNVVASSGLKTDELSADQKMAGYREILDALIIDKLVSRKASSVEVGDSDLDAEIARIKSQFPSEEVFKTEMAKANETDASFRETVKKMLQQQKWMESQVGDKAKIDDAEIRKFYDDNQKEFERPETVRASHILIRVPENASDEVVAEKKAAAMAALQRVSTQPAAEGGGFVAWIKSLFGSKPVEPVEDNFATVAKEVSEEPGAKESGGDLNFFPKDRMVPEFAEAAFAMQKGDVSKEPVRTQFGWHIIKVTDRREAGLMPFEEVKTQIAAFLEGSKRPEAERAVIDRIRAEAKVENKLPAAPAAPPVTSNQP